MSQARSSPHNEPATAFIAGLDDRGIVSVTGDDAGKLLAGIITNDMAMLSTEPALFAGLLSPQGKILFDFFVVPTPHGYLLDVALGQAASFVKRLSMYKLRAKAEITDFSANARVLAIWGGAIEWRGPFAAYRDPRAPALGLRVIAPKATMSDPLPIGSASGKHVPASDYHAHRIGLAVPEGGKDYDFGDVYPHDAGFDLWHGVAFDKGCYVGQEVVARMQHKALIRKRVVGVNGASDFVINDASREIRAGEAVIGRLGSIAGRVGLAMLRLDRVAEAIEKGVPLVCAGIPLTVDKVAVGRYLSDAAAHGVKS